MLRWLIEALYLIPQMAIVMVIINLVVRMIQKKKPQGKKIKSY